MKISKVLFSLIAGASVLTMTSCSNIDEDERYIPVEWSHSDRVVLIQEFTGMNCINCPRAAATVHTLMELNPGKIVVVGLHPFNNPNTTPLKGFDFRTQLATDYAEYYSTRDFPAAIIDNTSFDGSMVSNTIDKWGEYVSREFLRTPECDLYLTSNYDSSSRDVTVDYRVVFPAGFASECNIVLWLTENNIVAPQRQADGSYSTDYVHNHVLRAGFNGMWGDSLGSSFGIQQEVTGSLTLHIEEGWAAENCEIVGAVLRTENHAVAQAAATAVIGE